MRVLVTGASGFIGSHLVARLAETGHDVFGLLRPGRSIPRSDPRSPVQMVSVDLDDRYAVARLLESVRPEGIVHLAWFARPGAFWTAPENLDDVARTLELAHLAVSAGCRRWLGAGTCAEYDWTTGGDLHETRTPCNPATLYGTAKWATFRILQRFFAGTTTSFAWLRYNFVYGPGEPPGRLVPAVIETLSRGKDAECSEGKQLRDFLHVSDLAAATAACLDSPVEGPVNIGSGELTSVREVVETISKIIGGPGQPRFGARTAGNEPERIAPDLGRLFGEVGWRPAMSLCKGLEDTVENHRRKG